MEKEDILSWLGELNEK